MITIIGKIVFLGTSVVKDLQPSGSDILEITVDKKGTFNVINGKLNIDNSAFKFELEADPGDKITKINSSGLWITNNNQTLLTNWKLSVAENIIDLVIPNIPNSDISGVVLNYVLVDIKHISIPSNTEVSTVATHVNTVATNTNSINTGIDNLTNSLNTYPLMISDSDVGRGRTASALSGHSDSNLNRIAESAMRKILGRVPAPSDYKSFRNSLNQSFEIRQVEGHTEYTWNPRGYAGQADLGGGVTGHQASIYKRAKVMLENVIPLLDGLHSLKVNTDLEAAEGIRNIIKSSLEGVVRELGLEGGPRVAKVDDLFERVKSMLDKFAELYGLKNKKLVDSLEKDLNFSSYLAVKDYINSIKQSWDNSKGKLSKDLGAKLITLSRRLSVTAESVSELIWAFDSVYVGQSERKTTKVKDLTIQDYLDWVLHFTEEEAPNLIHVGGRNGISQLKKPIKALRVYADELSKLANQPRVNNAIKSLLVNLEKIGNEADSAFSK